MKITCFCMFKNEAAIMPSFLDQMEEFFDHVILVDHGSTDVSADMVRERGNPGFELLSLKASGYPQQQLANSFGRILLERHAAEFIFFLDCDEFLPFPNRAALEKFLVPYQSVDAISIPWLNIFPAPLDKGDIFKGGFVHRGALSHIRKVVLTGRIAHRQGWTVSQGYHQVTPQAGITLNIAKDDAYPLYHVPIQSRTQFRFKIANGSRTLKRTSLLRSNLGWHWVDLDDKAKARPMDEAALLDVALRYGDEEAFPDITAKMLDFDFPYVRSPFRENAETICGQLDGLLQHYDRPSAPADAASFAVTDASGQIILSSGPSPTPLAGPRRSPSPLSLQLFEGDSEAYADLIEPLFKLPMKLPDTAWIGHIPFLFALFRALRPARYVELGVHNGASLIAAATAAATYNVPTLLTGVDTWQGDDHAGRYEGDHIHQSLLDYTRRHFPGVTLQRSLFDEARHTFLSGSIDILHIDGLHTYDAVKHDFTTWFEKISPQGIILFHDISVLDRGFGVFRLWAELKKHFTTLEFHHSHGLGVLFLDPDDIRVAPFMRLARSQESLLVYQSLVADIAALLPERMLAMQAVEGVPMSMGTQADRSDQNYSMSSVSELVEQLRQKQDHINQLMQSTSWRATRPLRMLSRALGR